MILRLLLAALLLIGVSQARAEWCQTVMLPESDGNGGAITVQPWHNYVIQYHYPPAAARVGLEFWSHAFPPSAPVNSQYLLVYLNRADKPGRRIFHAWNAGPEHGTGLAVNFPMSTWMHPGESLVVNWYNTSGMPQAGYLIVTVRECYP